MTTNNVANEPAGDEVSRLREQRANDEQQSANQSSASERLTRVEAELELFRALVESAIDSNCAQQVIEPLLMGVAASRATTAILDITGVQVVDTQVANALLRAVAKSLATPTQTSRAMGAS